MMLEKLKIAKQAVEENGLIEAMQCFHFYGNRVQATSSRITIDCVSELNAETSYSVNASKFFTIMDILGKDHQIKIEENIVKLSNSKYNMKIEALKESWELIKQPRFTAKDVVSPGLLEALKTLGPFVSKDASKPELCSVLFKDGWGYAMSYASLARVPVPFKQEFSVPYFVVPVLLSMEIDPFAIVLLEEGTFLFYEDSTWIKFTPFSQGWPAVEQIISELDLSQTQQVPEDFGEIVSNIVRVVKLSSLPIKAIIFDQNGIRSNDESCAVIWGGMAFNEAVFSCDVIEAIANNCTHIDVAKYPGRIPFCHLDKQIEGFIMGMRLL
jgi:hypothetical protein